MLILFKSDSIDNLEHTVFFGKSSISQYSVELSFVKLLYLFDILWHSQPPEITWSQWAYSLHGTCEFAEHVNAIVIYKIGPNHRKCLHRWSNTQHWYNMIHPSHYSTSLQYLRVHFFIALCFLHCALNKE